MGFFSRSDDAAAWPRVSSGDGPPPEALGGFRSSAGVVDGQLDVQNIVRGQVGSELQPWTDPQGTLGGPPHTLGFRCE